MELGSEIAGIQSTFDELGRPLCDITFCVVDLETTGGSAARGSKITEFGAVKVRGGEVLGEFQTLVNPDEIIPAFITVLTGITNSMVINAPRIAEALPSFLEFAHGAVLVAHNAPFDVGFLKHASRSLDIDMDVDRVIDLLSWGRDHVSLDSPIDEDGDTSLGDLIARETQPGPDLAVIDDEMRELLTRLIDHLDEREADIVRARFGLLDGRQQKLSDIGKRHGISAERVRQLERQALATLRRIADPDLAA